MFIKPEEVSALPSSISSPVLVQRLNHEIDSNLDPTKRSWMAGLPWGLRLEIAQYVIANRKFDELMTGIKGLSAYSGPLPPDPGAAARLIHGMVFKSNPGSLELDPACASIVPVHPQHRSALSGLENGLHASSVDWRRATIKALRQDDLVYTDTQGAIPASVIALNRRALKALVAEVGTGRAVFSLERGGSLVADHIQNLLRQGILNIKVPKLEDDTAIVERRPRTGHYDPWWIYQNFQDPEYQRNDHAERFKRAVRTFMARTHETPVTVVLTEVVVGGASATKIMEIADTLLHEFPELKLKILLERQTAHQDNPANAMQVFRAKPHAKSESYKLFEGRTESIPMKLTSIEAPPAPRHPKDPRGPVNYNADLVQRAEVTLADARYVLAEDVNYQLSYVGTDSHQPVIVFTENSSGVVTALQLVPRGPMTAREIIQKLIEGAYDYVLASYGIRIAPAEH